MLFWERREEREKVSLPSSTRKAASLQVTSGALRFLAEEEAASISAPVVREITMTIIINLSGVVYNVPLANGEIAAVAFSGDPTQPLQQPWMPSTAGQLRKGGGTETHSHTYRERERERERDKWHLFAADMRFSQEFSLPILFRSVAYKVSPDFDGSTAF